MSVLIPGMEMPTSCDKCFFDTRCDNWRLRNWGAPPPDDCPLVSVPDHGRLIDADALKSDGFHTLVCYTGKMPYEYTAMLIDDVPTIIQAEEGE